MKDALGLTLGALLDIPFESRSPMQREAITAAREALAQPEQEPVSHVVIAGALFDFMGYLTSRKKRIVLSASDDAVPAVDAIRDFAEKRGLSLNDAQVREWIDALAQPEQEPQVRTGDCLRVGVCASEGHKIQAQRPWVGLTDDEASWCQAPSTIQTWKRIEAKLKELNT